MPTEQRSTVQLLSQMRHDMRMSLIGIRDLAQLLKNALAHSRFAYRSEILFLAISACLDFQTAWLDDIIVQSTQDHEFCLRNVITQAIYLVKPRLQVKNLGLDFCFDETLPDRVYGDSLRLFRIVHELLTNAIKFTEAGMITAHFMPVSLNDRSFLLHGCIADTGAGIADHEKNAIFDRFYRGTTSPSGCGMGLSQVKNDINAMQGSIQVHSQLGQGTCFQFSIPLRMKTVLSNTPFVNQKKTLSGMRALLIEDHPVTAAATKAMLAESGCCVEVVQDGESAISCVSQNHHDFILLDLHLPDIHGLDLYRILRTLNQRTQIIGLTADRQPYEKNSVLRQSDAILEKPLSLEKLCHVLRCN